MSRTTVANTPAQVRRNTSSKSIEGSKSKAPSSARGTGGQPEEGIDKVFKVLADPTRRGLLDLLHGDNGQTLTALCEHMDMTRQRVTQHLQLLEEANLVAIVWQGREKLHCEVPIQSRRAKTDAMMNSSLKDDPVIARFRAAVSGIYGERLDRVVLFWLSGTRRRVNAPRT